MIFFYSEFVHQHVLLGEKGLWKMPSEGPQTIVECFETGLKIAGESGVLCGIPQADGTYTTKTYG